MQSVKVDRVLRAGVVLLAAALIFVLYAAIHERVVVAGDSAPDFSIATDSGRTVSLPNFGGKVLVLNFWASWCPPCVQETPSLSRFAQAYAPKGVVVLALSVDKDAKAYSAFLQKYRPAFLTARDSKLHEDFGTYMYPETYIIDAKGRVLKKIAEGADWTDPSLTQYFDSLL
ncbi:MAG TPA: TlpA disulfide reductase family protein [Candidatus Limnocylindrales bacterium]|jgi:cytochrome c biogenesis protein CcmG/thiol:disulfide interchange protein DsbE|nr:TlpA disulfide reductase family protein [Candidatus Limnocylindrales bacterium]